MSPAAAASQMRSYKHRTGFLAIWAADLSARRRTRSTEHATENVSGRRYPSSGG